MTYLKTGPALPLRRSQDREPTPAVLLLEGPLTPSRKPAQDYGGLSWGAKMAVSAPSIEQPEVGWRSFERESVLHAFLMNPMLTWTSAGLSSWYGIRLDLVRAILSELAEERIIYRPPGKPDQYTLDSEDQRPSSVSGQATDPPERDEIEYQPLRFETGSGLEETLVAEHEVVSMSTEKGAR